MSKITLNLGSPNPKQALFYRSRTLFTAYGGAKGGGKTHAVRTKAVGGAIRWQNIRILILRRTYPELQQNHIDPILKLVPRELASYNAASHTLYFSGGSIIKFGHFQGPAAELEYQGQEYDWIFLDEATQFSEREFRFLGGCLRGMSPAPKRFYITCNPGGIGHAWVKRLFIDRDFKDSERPKDYSFIFASVEDNTALLKSSPAYLQMLEALPDNLRNAYRFGDWNALSGAYFSEFDPAVHVVEPFAIPHNWLRYRAFDYGLDMLACLWLAVDPDGFCFVYRELNSPGLIVSDAAELIRSHTLTHEHIEITFAPPDMWNRQKDSGRTMAELFLAASLPIVKASNSRVQGHIQIKELLRFSNIRPPTLRFFSDCRNIIRDIQTIIADPDNPNDCARFPHDVTHSVDALRYFAVSRLPKPDSYSFRHLAEYDDFMTGGQPGHGYF